jgi:hypothetical protein
MPLVRTEMIAPTKIYEYAPALEVDEAIDPAILDDPSATGATLGISSVSDSHAPIPRNLLCD